MHPTAAGSAPTTCRGELMSMPGTPQRHSYNSLVLGHAAPLAALLLARPGGVGGAAFALLLRSHRLLLIAIRLLACRGNGLGRVGVGWGEGCGAQGCGGWAWGEGRGFRRYRVRAHGPPGAGGPPHGVAAWRSEVRSMPHGRMHR